MIKAGDIVRVTDWGRGYPTNANHIIGLFNSGKIELEWVAHYAYGDAGKYYTHKNTDDNRYRVLFIDEQKALITDSNTSILGAVFCLGTNGIELYDEPVEMTIAEIEEKLGIKNLKVVKENC